MLTVEALVAPGDRVVVVTPLWPNLVEIPKILSADVVCVPLDFGAAGWTLDVDRLLDALTPGTRALMINSPNNPTGWTIDRAAQRAVLEHCERLGIWIVADDVYERLYFADDATCAPSFLDIAGRDARVVSTNSFSKAWLMTGWRLGWIVAPEALMPEIGKLIEYNTSCSPVFVQRAGIAAMTGGEATAVATRERLRRARDRLIGNLARAARRRCRVAGRCDVCVLPHRRDRGQHGVLPAARAGGEARPGAWQRIRARRRRLRPLVLRGERRASRRRRRAPCAVPRVGAPSR